MHEHEVAESEDRLFVRSHRAFLGRLGDLQRECRRFPGTPAASAARESSTSATERPTARVAGTARTGSNDGPDTLAAAATSFLEGESDRTETGSVKAIGIDPDRLRQIRELYHRPW